MIRKLVSWLFEDQGPCGVCGGKLDKDHGEIQYIPAYESEPCYMKVCSNCIVGLENEHQNFVNQLENWKKHEEL